MLVVWDEQTRSIPAELQMRLLWQESGSPVDILKTFAYLGLITDESEMSYVAPDLVICANGWGREDDRARLG